MKNREKDAKNRARSNNRIGRRAGGSVPGLDDNPYWSFSHPKNDNGLQSLSPIVTDGVLHNKDGPTHTA